MDGLALAAACLLLGIAVSIIIVADVLNDRATRRFDRLVATRQARRRHQRRPRRRPGGTTAKRPLPRAGSQHAATLASAAPEGSPWPDVLNASFMNTEDERPWCLTGTKD
jgi:hypothetical protein